MKLRPKIIPPALQRAQASLGEWTQHPDPFLSGIAWQFHTSSPRVYLWAQISTTQTYRVRAGDGGWLPWSDPVTGPIGATQITAEGWVYHFMRVYEDARQEKWRAAATTLAPDTVRRARMQIVPATADTPKVIIVDDGAG